MSKASFVLAIALVVSVTAAGCSGSSVDRRDTFASITGLPPIQALAENGPAIAALARDGVVYAWGGNYYGQAGDVPDDDCGNTMNRRPCHRAPTVIALPGFGSAIAVGDDHDLALTRDGAVWTWGADHTPGPGTGSERVCGNSRCRAVAVVVAGLPPVTAISAGRAVDVALASDGQVWVWGAMIDGPDRCTGAPGPSPGTFACSVRPRPVPGLPPVTAVSAAAEGRITALDAQGTVWWWGTGYPGPYPIGTAPYAAPRRMDLPIQVTAIVAAGSTTVGVGADGSVWLWGRPNAYDLPRCVAADACVTTPLQTLPAGSATEPVPSGSLRVRSPAGGDLSYGPTPSSGYGPPLSGSPPIPVDPPMERGWFLESPGPGTRAVVSGDDGAATIQGSVALVLTEEGQVLARGDNTYGQLGI